MPPAPPPLLPPPPPSDAPSPIGLIVAGAGLILLCLSVLLPRISVDYGEAEEEYAFYGYSTLAGEGFGIDTATVVLSVALLCAVGLSAYRNPAFRWPTRIAAVGLAALTAAFSYHPVTVLQQSYSSYDAEGVTEQVDISADNGVYIAVFASVLLAAAAFLMQRRSPRQAYYAAPPAPAQPGGPGQPGGQGPEPTVTVTPGY